MAYRLVVDYLKCEGNGYCMSVAPHLIQQAPDGMPLIAADTLDAVHQQAAQLAVQSCPMNALSIEVVAAAE